MGDWLDRQWLGVVESTHVVPCEDCGRPRALLGLRLYARGLKGLERASAVVDVDHVCSRKPWRRREPLDEDDAAG